MNLKKADHKAAERITKALRDVGIVRFAELFQIAVENNHLLAWGLDSLEEKREKQFAKGIKLIKKARRGAENDDEDSTFQEEDDDDFCASCGQHFGPHFMGRVHAVMSGKYRTRDSIAETVSEWTGLTIKLGDSSELLRFKPKKLAKKMRKCLTIGELRDLLEEKFGGVATITNPRNPQKRLKRYDLLTRAKAGYVVYLLDI